MVFIDLINTNNGKISKAQRYKIKMKLDWFCKKRPENTNLKMLVAYTNII
jgi:hypothetical protein